MTHEDSGSDAGAVVWTDLTVENAAEVRDFYGQVIGWSFTALDMGGYDDFVMKNPLNGKTIAGVCHAKGPNAKLPPQWLIYVRVDDIGRCVQRCTELGGEVVDGPREMGGETFCVIRDPAGAVCALMGPLQNPRSS